VSTIEYIVELLIVVFKIVEFVRILDAANI